MTITVQEITHLIPTSGIVRRVAERIGSDTLWQAYTNVPLPDGNNRLEVAHGATGGDAVVSLRKTLRAKIAEHQSAILLLETALQELDG